MELNRFDEAVECYDKSLILDPDNEIFLSNKGVAFMELNQFEEAAQCFRKTLIINPENEDAQILMDECLENL
jgi:Putative Zn-dependent protease, contains TPR repeats